MLRRSSNAFWDELSVGVAVLSGDTVLRMGASVLLLIEGDDDALPPPMPSII